MQHIKASKYYQEQFESIQAQTGMSPRTLWFSKEYEATYSEYIQQSAVNRTRICFLVGFLSLGVYFWWDMTWRFQPDDNHVEYKLVLYILSFGIALPSFGFGLILTFIPAMRAHTEKISFCVFALVALVLIAMKPIERLKGPVLPLVILIIPIFGITRMRFIYSTILGWSIFFLYITVQLIATKYIGPGWDTSSDIFYQCINYGISIIGGMVSNYRQVD